MARGFMQPVLESMGRGDFFRQVVASVMRVGGIIGLIVAGVGTVIAIVTGFEISGPNGLGGIAIGCAWVLASIASLEILMYRGRKVDELPDSGYSVLSVFSQLIRAVGEVGATYAILFGLGGGFAAWITEVLVVGESGFVAGVTVFASLVTLGFVGLFVCYFIAEYVNLTVNIANNTK